MLLYDLVSRNVNHIEFNCQVGTSCINTQSLLVVKQDDLGWEFANQVLLTCFEGRICIEVDDVNAGAIIRQIMSHCINCITCISNWFIDGFLLLRCDFFSIILLFVSINEILFLSLEAKQEVWNAKWLNEIEEFFNITVSKSIESILNSLRWLLTLFNHS